MAANGWARAKREGQRGVALLAVIFLLMIASVSLLAVTPNVKIQAQREREIEAYYRGDQMAEAIARYYAGGRLNPSAGLVVKSPPPPYGFLTELKKLRDGVTIGANQLYLCRRSAFIDPLTGQEWEPVRIGDPRLRRYFRAWQQATGRPLPPIYTQYMGGSNIVDTSPKPVATPDAGGQTPNDQPPPQVQPGDTAPPDEDFEDDDDDDEDFEDDDDDDTGDDDDDGGSAKTGPSELTAPGSDAFVNASYQAVPPASSQDSSDDDDDDQPGGTARPGATAQPGSTTQPFQGGSVFGRTTRLGPIIGVATKAKGASVRTRFGISKYEDMIFVYFPPAPIGLPNQPPPQPNQQGGTGNKPASNDFDGDGIDDSVKPNPGAGDGDDDDDN
jgi:hypothetical protein